MPASAASRSCLRTRKRTAMGRCLRSPPQQEPRRAKKLPSPRSTRRPSPSIPPLRNVANAISKSTMNGRSSQHAYASISPMFHAFEQKFQELTKGTVGTFCVRCHQQVGTQLGEKRETPLWAMSQISREGVTLHHLPPGQGAVRQGQRRAPGRAGQDLRAGLRQRRKERPQGHPRQQGDLLRQNQQGRAGHGHPQRHDDEPPAHQVGVLRQLPSGCGQLGHQAGDRLGSVSRQPGTQRQASPARTATWARSPESPRAMRPRPPP